MSAMSSFNQIHGLCRTCLRPQQDKEIVYKVHPVNEQGAVEQPTEMILVPPLSPNIHYSAPSECKNFQTSATNHRTKSIVSLCHHQQPFNGGYCTIDDANFHTLSVIELLSLAIPQLCITTDGEDALPQQLCSQCLDKLWKVLRFQKMCLKADEQLKCMLKQHTSQLPVSETNDAINDAMSLKEISENNDLQSAENGVVESLSMSLPMDKAISELCANVYQSDEFCTLSNNGVVSNDVAECRNFSEMGKETTKSNPQKLEETIQIDTEWKLSSSADKEPLDDDLKHKKRNTKQNLNRHSEYHLRPTKESLKRSRGSTLQKVKHQCDFCNKIFQQSSTLKDHLRVHTGEQPFLCSECGKAFKSLSNMKQHLLRHNNDRRYECPDCPKKFPCLSDLASHKAVHYKNKVHICDICGSGFIKPYQLKKHKMYHNGDKPHKCEYCDMRFVLADQMRRHMRTHTGEKPYKCKYCTRAFAQSNDLVKHLRSHLGENVYKCELCPQSFRLIKELRTHFTTHKNEDVETRARNLQALREEETRLLLKFGLQ